jgi:hypothetical protein
MASQPFTAAFHNTLEPDIPGNTSVSSVMPGYPDNLSLSLSGGGKRKNKRRSNKRSKRSKRSRSSRRNPEEKVVRGARLQTRPSASHYYNKLNKPVGYKISYRPRKGGKYIMHKLALRKNGNPFWKALEKLPKKSRKGRKTERSRTTRRNSRGQKVRTRRPRYLNRRGNGGTALMRKSMVEIGKDASTVVAKGIQNAMNRVPSPPSADAVFEAAGEKLIEHSEDEGKALAGLSGTFSEFNRRAVGRMIADSRTHPTNYNKSQKW